MSDFLDALGLTMPEPHHPKTFKTDVTAGVTFVGYSTDEIITLLGAYREHCALLIAQMQSAQSASDAVHYTPDMHVRPASGFEGFAGDGN